jgi:ubiquinone/menaquinone biosynthesis C-methylase UbiE
MLQTLADLFYRLPAIVRHPVEKTWYEHMSHIDRDADMTFMNYGWASLDSAVQALALHPEDERNRYSIQLYHHVTSAINLRGLDVLEVGCGRGGGASYVMRYMKPQSLTGLDLAAKAVAFCKTHYTIPGLTFVRGRAEALEFEAESFDAVINVESSHCYTAMDRFLSGIVRVLKPGGHFLFADTRYVEQVDKLRRQIKASGLTLLQEENINANVTQALKLDNARKKALIRHKISGILRPLFNEFAGMEGTRSSYATLCCGDKVYLRFVLQKQGSGYA